MRASVVIATSNRSAGLCAVLEALRHQTFRDFEVIVVKGPSQDETDAVLAERESWLRVVANPELNLSKSRNLGIDAAAGEIVAFIDDDAIPEPRWLEDLMAAYTDQRVAGAGGPVYDVTGVNLQYRYAVCDRIGHTVFDHDALLDVHSRPQADPFVYLQGTNMSFRRTALEAVGGFDENIEYIYDDVDIAMQIIDRGGQVRSLDTAFVHHKVLPSGLRRSKGEITDPFVPVKNRSYFALRSGRGRRPFEAIVRSLTEYLDVLRAHAASAEQNRRFSFREARHFVARMEAGFQAGFTQGIESPRAGRSLAGRDEAAFKPYPVIHAGDERLSVCLVSVDFPPKPMGGIARYTVDWARGMAAAGHEVHVVTQAEAPYRLEFEDGVWVHRFPGGERWLPSLDGHPLRGNLAHVAAVWRTVAEVAERFPLDLVAGNVWLAEVMACALDPRWPTVMTLSTPIRTIAATQPAVASKPEVAWQIELEDLALQQADQLHPLSQANLDHVRTYSPSAVDVPAEVVWLGMADRATAETQPPHDGVEILFVGRLEPRKGIDTLLEAAVPLLTEHPEARLRVVGADNPYASEDPRPYTERVRENLGNHPDVLARITFEGEVNELRLDQLFQACDIFCAPSRYESFGLMNLEAMMFSRPVVSCRVGGIPEVVVHGETGLLVEPADAAGLLDALRALVDEPELRQRLGEAGRRRYEAEFTNEIAVERILELFARTVRRVPGQSIAPQRAELEVRERFAAVLRGLDGIDAPEQTAEELLERVAFPHDYRAALARLEGTSDHEFIAGLYRSILRREADGEGLESRAGLLANGVWSRTQVVRDIATSPEARLLGVDARFVETLPPEAPPEMVRQIRGAFWRDDESFASLLADVLLSPAAPRAEEVAELVGALAAGADRRAVLSDLVRRPDVHDRLPDAQALLREQFLTTDDLAASLRRLAGQDDSAFVAGLYQLLLGREPEPEGAAGMAARLATVSRRQVIGEIAASVEATRRGVDPAVVAQVVGAIGAFDSPPSPPSMSQRLQSLPGGRRARGVGRRILRDPEVRQLGRELHELKAVLDAQGKEMHAHELERENAVTQAAASIDGVNRAIRGLELDTDDWRQGFANELLDRLGEDVGRRVAEEFRSRLSPEGLSDVRDAITAELLERLPKPGSYGTYLGDGRILVGMTWGGMLLTPADDLSLTPELATHGIYEAPFTRYLMRTLKPGQHAIDVGANIGMYTVLMAAWVGPGGQVLAYEPNPDVLSFLRDNIALNWVNDRVSVREAGASDASGRITLYVTERFKGNSSLEKPGEDYYANLPTDTVREIEVAVEPLDSGAESLGHVDIVKIDVEGAEHRVMGGMTRLLSQRLVDRVSFEVYRERMGEPWAEFSELLRGHASRGWRFHDIADDGALRATDLEEILRVGRYSQVVMTGPQLPG